MFQPFFAAAMLAPGRQLTFRRVVVAHLLFLTALIWGAIRAPDSQTVTTVGYLTLVLGIVEGAALIGWRLTQLPKSQALEFLLTSPMQPQQLFFAEALVGVCRFALVWLSGLPVFGLLVFTGTVGWSDLLPLAVMPAIWGVFAGIGLTAWVYEPVAVRRIGEVLGMLGVLVYLIVGVVAGENLLMWLRQLPEWLGRILFDSVLMLHDLNPFGMVRYWFASDSVDWVAWERFEILHGVALLMIALVGFRAASRLKGHFHDRHYKPIDSRRADQSAMIGDRPLSWWAVRRVMEYSGRVNLWLAGGFCLLYAAFIIAGDAWPPWMGRLVFMMFEQWGGAPVVATAMVVLSAVPAVFQFGLWDPTIQERCRRLELLLLTDLTPQDYWHASLSAAWKRGRGYLVSSGMLWLALGISGRNGWSDVFAAIVGGAVLWAVSFAVGFRVFASGNQTNGTASLVTLGLPLLLFGVLKVGWDSAAYLIPTSLCYLPLRDGTNVRWIAAAMVFSTLAWWLSQRGLQRCDGDLRKWYDANQGKKSAE